MRLRTALLSVLAIAATSEASNSYAQAGEHPWPYLKTIPCRTASACNRADWDTFLAGLGTSELTSPAGGRAYRWLWVNQSPSALGPVPSIGFVEVILDATGSGEIHSGWCKKPVHIVASDIEPFESALAHTDFEILPEQDNNAANWLDYPPEQLMEAYVGGKYHFLHRVGGIPEPGIQDAGVLLEKLAQRVCR